MHQTSTGALQRATWSPALLDAFGSDVKGDYNIGDDIPESMASAANRPLLMQCNIYKANVYSYSFLRKDGQEQPSAD